MSVDKTRRCDYAIHSLTKGRAYRTDEKKQLTNRPQNPGSMRPGGVFVSPFGGCVTQDPNAFFLFAVYAPPRRGRSFVMAKCILELNGVRVSFADRLVLDLDRLSVYDGDRIGLIGEIGRAHV